MKHGEWVTRLEHAFAERVGAKYAIAMTNGTVTLEVALRTLRVGVGDKIETTPLTMSATSMAILNVGAMPMYRDVDPKTWLMREPTQRLAIGVSLYGLHYPHPVAIDDAAQTLRPHGGASFTSYSFQRSKIVQTGEGGMLVTDDRALAVRARSIASLGYDLGATQSRIDVATLKSPTAVRHVRHGMNARMNDITAQEGIRQLARADELLAIRRACYELYSTVTHGIAGVTPQHIPHGAGHDHWAFTIALDDADAVRPLQDAIVARGGERPYGAWRLTFDEPAFAHEGINGGWCFNARSLQPRLLQFQTNDLGTAALNARALRAALLGAPV